jgi:hypothetical protein
MLTLGLLGCPSFQVHPFEVGITLPYSGDCRFKNVVTGAVREVSAEICDGIKRRSLILTSEAWRVIRTDVQNNCAETQCVQLNGKVDDIFLTIEQGLSKVPF